MTARYDANDVSYPGDTNRIPRRPCGPGTWDSDAYSWPGPTIPKIIVTEVQVLDSAGGSVGVGTLSIASGVSDLAGQRSVTRNVIGACSTCGNAALIRHVLAFAPYKQRVQFVLEDALVPVF